MFLGTRFQTNNMNEIYLDGCKLARIEKARFLGITIDKNLTAHNWQKWKIRFLIHVICPCHKTYREL